VDGEVSSKCRLVVASYSSSTGSCGGNLVELDKMLMVRTGRYRAVKTVHTNSKQSKLVTTTDAIG
jgi:hypothetical protein